MRVRYLKAQGSSFREQLLEVQLEKDPAIETAQRLLSFRDVPGTLPSGDEPWIHSGLFDSHLHVSWLGEIERRVMGTSFESLNEYIEALSAELAKTPIGETMVSYGFDENRWEVSKDEFVSRVLAKLDADRKWLLYRICGHSALASLALLDSLGLPGAASLLDDTLIHALQARLPLPSRERVKEDFLRAQARLLDAGISAVGDMSLDRSLIPALLELCADELIDVDFQGVMIDEAPDGGYLKYPVLNDSNSRHFEIRHWKRYLDGSFGSRTAWLRAPYSDAPQTVGLALYETQELVEAAHRALQKGFALSFHAIGDAALEQLLEMSELLKSEMKAMNDRVGRKVHRIEHAQLLGDDQLRRLVDLDLWTVCLQPYHRIADSIFVDGRLGQERMHQMAYRLGSLFRAGLPLSLGSDAPITIFDPLSTIEAAMQTPNEHEQLDFANLLWLYSEGGRSKHGLPRRELRAGSRVWLLEPRAKKS